MAQQGIKHRSHGCDHRVPLPTSVQHVSKGQEASKAAEVKTAALA